MADHRRERPWIPTLARRAKRIALISVSTLVASMFSAVGLLMLLSPGKARPFLDRNGQPLADSISEKAYVDINGVKQGMFIKGKNVGNPVLLYLHGGMPEYFLTHKHPTGLEDYFTVVWWEQRGSGLSYHPDLPPETMSAEQFVSDTLEVTNYLRRRFNQEKIYLMAHSGGTFFGIQAAARAPELYHAYIGMEQMSSQRESECLAYDYMLEAFEKNGNQAMVRKLKSAPVTLSGGVPDAYVSVRDLAMHSLGIGTMREINSVITGVFLVSLMVPEYSLAEKVNLWRGKFKSGVGYLFEEALATDLRTKVTAVSVPVYFLHGVYDYTVSYPLALDYFRRLKAPQKGFYSFPQSAHSPAFEEPERARRIVREDVLRGATTLADAPS